MYKTLNELAQTIVNVFSLNAVLMIILKANIRCPSLLLGNLNRVLRRYLRYRIPTRKSCKTLMSFSF